MFATADNTGVCIYLLRNQVHVCYSRQQSRVDVFLGSLFSLPDVLLLGQHCTYSPPLFILLCTPLWCWTAAVGWTGGLAGIMALSCLRRRDEPRHRPCPATRGLLLCFQGNQAALPELDDSSPATTTHRSQQVAPPSPSAHSLAANLPTRASAIVIS